jgi:hypothetical protein
LEAFIAAVTDMGGIPDLDADRRWLLAIGCWPGSEAPVCALNNGDPRYINELYKDSAESRESQFKGISDSVLEVVKKLWKYEIPRTARHPILQKYEMAL